MKILVTGAGGMVGSHMVERFFREGHDVIGTFYKPTVDLSEIPPEIKMIECDVRYSKNLERIISDFLPDKIFHLAAQSYPTVSWTKPYETIETNINGTIAVFEAIKFVRKFVSTAYDPMVVVACSSAEYGQTLNELENDCVDESAELKPLHPYGVSKVGQDLISYQYFMNDNIKCIRARIFNSTGTRKINDVTSDFTKRAIECLKNNNLTLIVGNLETKRAIMDQQDLISALILLSDKGKPGEAYNICSEHVYKISDIVSLIEKQLNVKFDIKVDQKLLRPTDEKIIVGNIDKLKKDTNWRQMIPMEETIKEMLNYWQNKIGLL